MKQKNIKEFIKRYKLDNISNENDFEENIKYVITTMTAHKINGRGIDPFREKIKNIIKNKTSFLPDSSTLAQRIWHIENDLFDIKKCSECGKDVKFSVSRKRYSFCSIRCSKKCPKQQILIKDTLIKRYGVDNPSKIEGASLKAEETSLKRYGVRHVSELEYFKEKAKTTNMIKYGAPTKKQMYLMDQVSNYQNPEWLVQQNIELKKSVVEIASGLNVSATTIGLYFKKNNIEIKEYYQSIAEKKLCDLLSPLFNIIQKSKKIISPYEIDIFIPEKNIAIEYNGLYWHSDAQKEKSYHKQKYDMCKENGIRLITIFENEWTENEELIKTKILSILGVNNLKNIYARKTKIQQIDSSVKAKFFNTNHIQGDGPSSLNYGAYYNDELVAAIGFIRHKDHYVLNRYATSCNVVGGFSKLLKHFEREFNDPKIITFADLRWSEGDLYYNTGFNMDGILSPDYYWIRAKKLWHKFNWRHGSGLKTLKNYDPKLSETVNMHNHGYNKIYDCGKIRFIKNKL